MALTDDLSDAFFQGVIDISSSLGCTPHDLLGVMMNESQVRANARNPRSNASGIIQFIPSNLPKLGWPHGPESFRQLTADEQLPFVERFFRPYVRFGLSSAARVYQAVFLPATLSLGSSSNTVISQRGGIYSFAYDGNKGLDANRDGKITVGELQLAIERHYSSGRWLEILERLNDVMVNGGQDPVDSGVIDLQTREGVIAALNAIGYDVDRFGLTACIKGFQRDEGLAMDGKFGPVTRRRMAQILDAEGIQYVA